MAQLNVKVVNSLGTFEGFIVVDGDDETLARQVMKNIIDNINSINLLSLEHTGGRATVFGQEILKQSVITVNVSG
jgi:hypothetical protein